jgi:hypothetical protein
MGDYDIKVSCYFNNALESVFSGNASFNGCALFSGKMKNDNTGIEGKLNGILRLDNNQVMLNFLKSDDENPVIEFQVYKKRDNLEYQGSYRGAWRCKQGIFKYEENLWSRRDAYERIWINELLIKERLALIELLPSQEQPQMETASETIPDQDLKTALTL